MRFTCLTLMAVTSWNAGAHRLKGYTKQEVLGQHFSRFYLGEDVSAGSMPQRALTHRGAGRRFEAEGWRVRKDGSRFWALRGGTTPSWRARLAARVRQGHARPDRTQSRKRVRRSEEQFRLLVQGVTDYAIYMLDPTGIITNWNAGAQRIKGYTR